MDVPNEQAVMRKVMWRLLPLLALCYIASFLDRVNVSFAALTMNRALGLSAAQYGFGFGIFFLSYSLFEIPSNLALACFGARRWIARIMLSWGVVSAAFAFIEPIASKTGVSNQTVFYVLRFLLGAAEAGFFPGIIYYLTLWVPESRRARFFALFALAVPVASIVGAPLSGYILTLHMPSFEGWRWLFIIEAVPSIALGLAAFYLLVDRPASAGRWLSSNEREWLTARLASEEHAVDPSALGRYRVLGAMRSRAIWVCGIVYFVAALEIWAFYAFLPTIIRGFKASYIQVGFLTALPSACSVIGMLVLSRSSDRIGKRRLHLAFAFCINAAGFAAVALSAHSTIMIGATCLAGFALVATLPLFWPLPSAYLPAIQAPAGIALINGLGNLAGFIGPSALGALKTETGGFSAGFAVLAICLVITAAMTLALPKTVKS